MRLRGGGGSGDDVSSEGEETSPPPPPPLLQKKVQLTVRILHTAVSSKQIIVNHKAIGTVVARR